MQKNKYKITGFNRDPINSLFVEAQKSRDIDQKKIIMTELQRKKPLKISYYGLIKMIIKLLLDEFMIRFKMMTLKIIQKLIRINKSNQ